MMPFSFFKMIKKNGLNVLHYYENRQIDTPLIKK